MAITYVIGLGRSGLGVSRLLQEKGKKVIVIESRVNDELIALSKGLIENGIEVKLGVPLSIDAFPCQNKDIEEIIISPGIAWDDKTLIKLRDRGVKVVSEISIAWQNLNHIPWIAVTGTNGKTTVSYLLHHILKQNGISSSMGGNVGLAASEVARQIASSHEKPPKWLIMEISSYQIEAGGDITPKIGIWTNLTPDHLERHKSLENYRNIKGSLLRRSEFRIFNYDDHDSKENKGKWGEGIWVSIKENVSQNHINDLWINSQGIVTSANGELFEACVLDMPGNHNLQNLLLVTAAALKVGIKAKDIEASLKTFKGVPHRLEKLGRIGSIEVFNDSKATNYDASSMGLDAVDAPIILIAGGQLKKGSVSKWLKTIEKKVCGIILFGEGAIYLKKIIGESKFKGELLCCENMKNAVEIAIDLKGKINARAIVLSPACASFDQYKDFEERGNHFRHLINPFLSESDK